MTSQFYIVLSDIGEMPERRFSCQDTAERAARQFSADDPESTYYIFKAVSQCRQIGLEIESFDEQ